MKALLVLIVSCFPVLIILAQPCYLSGLTLNSQAEVDQFIIDFPDCESIGPLHIEGEDIVDLTPLSNIINILGGLTIINNTTLSTLDGISQINILNNDLIIEDNPNLVEIIGFNNLLFMTDIRIVNNDALIEINGFSSIQELFKCLDIIQNDELQSIEMLEDLNLVNENFNISSNNKLVELNGFNSIIEVIGRITFFSNDLLEKIIGLKSIVKIGLGLELQNNPMLFDLSGFNNLAFLGSGLILNNTAIVKLVDFESLNVIDGALIISNNDKLLTIEGLSSLEEIGFSLSISDNPLLISLKGLHNFNWSNLLFILIEENSVLTTCSTFPICEFSKGPFQPDGNIILINNGPGCNTVDDLLEACIPDTTALLYDICPGEKISVHDTLLSDIGSFEFLTSSCIGIDSLLHVELIASDNCDICDFSESTLGVQIVKESKQNYLLMMRGEKVFKEEIIRFNKLEEELKNILDSKNAYRSRKRQIKISIKETLSVLEKMQVGGVIKI